MDMNTSSTRSYYSSYDVENRIKQDQAHRVEFLISMDVLKELFYTLDPNQSVAADIGCGTGNYTVELASFVSKLYACDMMPNLLNQLMLKIKQNKLSHILPVCNSAEHLVSIPDKSCDIALCMGPMYHLSESKSRALCLSELKRITKPNGQVVITYLNPKALWANILRGKMTVQEFEQVERLENVLISPFYFTTPKWIQNELAEHGFRTIKHIALDAFTSFMIYEVNKWNSSEYNSWLKIIRRHVEDPSWIEFSSHSLIIAEVDV